MDGPSLPSTAKWWLFSPTNPTSLWSFLSSTCILATTDEFFAKHNWKNVIILPYVHHADIPLKCTKQRSGNTEEDQIYLKKTKVINRDINFYFRGSFKHSSNCMRSEDQVNNIRQRMANIFKKDEKSLIIDTSHAINEHEIMKKNYDSKEYVSELFRSKYCLIPRGDTTTSRRFYDAIASGCIPVVISDDIHLPFNDIVQYDKFTVKLLQYTYIYFSLMIKYICIYLFILLYSSKFFTVCLIDFHQRRAYR